MTDEILLYYNPQSRARIVHWMLEEVGAPYRIELVRFDKRDNKSDAFLAINPMGKVPAIVHRGVVVTEAAAICTYLADAFPKAGLAPAFDDPARGTYLRWLFFAAGCVEPAIVDKSFSRPPVERPGANGYGTYEDTIATLERAVVPGPFILGERFSAADVYVGSAIGYGMMFKSIEPRPSFVAYQGRLAQRPAFQRVMAEAQKFTEQLKAP
ncbi:MAG TPA: glutathione S-transferase family protein [Kofleriaceae bacterium]|jgi:glutathione S-transferase|nr:glutathione S-transferase family protein [Kofleriaceae bacterium]